MKRIKFFCLTILLTILLLLVSNISFASQEDELTDFSKVEFELKQNVSSNAVSYKLYFNNVTFEKTHSYYVCITNSKDDTVEDNQTSGAIVDGVFSNIDAYLEKKGDIYISVLEDVNGERKIVLLSKKLDRPKQNDIGKRITGSFFTDSTGDTSIIFFNEPHDNSAESRKVKVKIGKVEDENILNKMKANGSSALNELLSYAKNQSAIYTETIPAEMYKKAFLSKVKLSNNGYYFVYFEAEDENGKYYPVEDVMLAQAQFRQNGEQIQLVNYTDSGFVWKTNTENGNVVDNKTQNIAKNNTNNEAHDNTVANKIIPAAGINVYITLFIMCVVLIAGIIYFKYRKYENIK